MIFVGILYGLRFGSRFREFVFIELIALGDVYDRL